MKRVTYHKFGGPEVMQLEEYKLRELKPDEVLVRVRAASLNPLDWKLRSGMLRMAMWKLPYAMGSDFAGVVEAVGAKVTNFKPGDAVIGATPFLAQGAFAPTVITEEKLLVAKPDSVSFEAGSALPIVGITAYGAVVEKGHVKRGQKVFVNGALGSVGRAAVQIAQSLGAAVGGSVGPSSVQEATKLGLSPVVDYTQPLPVELNGQFDLVLDTAGTLKVKQQRKLAKARTGVVVDINPGFSKFVTQLLYSRYHVLFADFVLIPKVVELAGQGTLSIPVAKRVPLEQAVDAIRGAETGKLKGKVVVVPGAA